MRTMDRREFLKRMGLLGGGVAVYITCGDAVSLAQRPAEIDFNALLHIGADGRVKCFTGKIEMGQGIITSLAQMLADELGVSLDCVDMVMGDTALCPPDYGTFGSLSTKVFGVSLRKGAAEARTALIEMAAEHFKLEPERLVVENGEVIDRAKPSRRITYARLTQGKRIERHVKSDVSIEPHSQHTLSGKPFTRVDAKQKVTGDAKYAGDIRLPGMLYAKILRPPAHGAKLKDVDTSDAAKMPGVHVVEEAGNVAVLHEHPDLAEKALKSVRARYDTPKSDLDNSTIFKHFLSAGLDSSVVTESGNLETGEGLAAKQFESVFFNHYVAHAPIETHTALVHVEGQKATAWVSTQAPFRAREEVARTLGMPPKSVRVITPFVGGGFGGKTRNQQVVEAAWLAKATGRPVQVAWSREEEFFYDTFRPAAVIKVRSGLDRQNRVVLWDYDNYCAGSRSSEPFYDIPHHRVLARGGWRSRVSVHPFGTGAWRAPGSNTNVFAMESQIDIMAHAAGVDPLTFRLYNLKNERMRKVLTAAADRFGRRFERSPSGKGYGIACTDYRGTYVATMAEAEVDGKTGQVKVERVVCAHDMGEIINPQGAKLQIEGAVTMGLGYVLKEEVRFSGGRILDKSFGTYKLPRFSWLPRIESVLIDNPDIPPQGCGEPAITPMGAVVANAVHDATGARLFELPMTPARVKEAMAKA